MILEFLLGAVSGISGLVPFIHPNTVLQFIESRGDAAFLSFIAAFSFSHAFFSVIPALSFSIIGTENAGMVLSEGKEWKKFQETMLAALLASAFLLPVAVVLLPLLQTQLKSYMAPALLLVLLFHFLGKSGLVEAAKDLLFFSLAGILGIVLFSSSILKEPLFPLLTGLFALPSLLFFEEEESGESTPGNVKKRVVVASSLFAMLSTLFPALTPSVVSGFALLLFRDKRAAFASIASVSAAKPFFDLSAALITGKTRSLAAVQAAGVNVPQAEGLAIIAVSAVAAAAFALLASKKLAGAFKEAYEKLKQPLWRKIIFLLLLAVVFAFGGFQGILVSLTACSLGICALKANSARSSLCGALIIPALLYFLGFGRI